MLGGHCHAGEKRSAQDYANGLSSVSLWSGILLVESSSSSLTVAEGDSKVLERALSGVLRTGVVRINSLELVDHELKVSFSCSFVLEKLGYEGLYSDEIEKSQVEIQSMMTDAMSSGALSVLLHDSIRLNPSSVSSLMSQMKSTTVSTFQMISITHEVLSKSSHSSSSGSLLDSTDLNVGSEEGT